GYRDGTARLVAAATGEALGQPLRHEEGVLVSAFSPDGAHFVTGSGFILRSGGAGSARLWETPREVRAEQTLPHTGPVSSVLFLPDGQTVVTGSRPGDYEAQQWDARTGRRLGQPWRQPGGPSFTGGLAVSPDGRTLAQASAGTVRLRDVASGELRKEFREG